MEITKLTAFIFSPTDTTAAVAKPLAEALLPGARIVDLTCADAEEERFGPDELVLFAAPVYGGRIPAPAAKRFARMKGTDTPALLVAVYGNRDYDDALLELCDLAEENGFRPAGAGAFLAEHSIFHSVARGRPDAADLEAVRTFAGLAREKLARGGGGGGVRPACRQGEPALPGIFRRAAQAPGGQKVREMRRLRRKLPRRGDPGGRPLQNGQQPLHLLHAVRQGLPGGGAQGERPHAVGGGKAVREEKQPAPGTRVGPLKGTVPFDWFFIANPGHPVVY